MKKLTKLQRHTAYLILLHEIEASAHLEFFCHLISRHFDLPNQQSSIQEYFLELWAKKPASDSDIVWWGKQNCSEGRVKRIQALKQCINETA